jgi:uncharacterized protein YbcI
MREAFSRARHRQPCSRGLFAAPWIGATMNVLVAAAWFSFSSFRAVRSRGRESWEDMHTQESRGSPSVDGERSGELMVEVSNAMVGLYKDLFGRGPTKAKTSYADPDLLVSTLENSLTRIERTMADAGEHERLRDLRMHFQYLGEDDFIQAVERITGRKVRAFVSGMDVKRDVASEIFYLEPQAQTSLT